MNSPVAAARPAPRFTIGRVTPTDATAIARLNTRLTAGGSPHEVYAEDDGLPDDAPFPRERLYVVREGEEIRAAAYLKEVRFRIGGAEHVIGWVKYPVSESLVSKQYSALPGALLMELMRRRPLLAAVGMGGHRGPFAQLLGGMKWRGHAVATMVLPLRFGAVARALPKMGVGGRIGTIAKMAGASGLADVGGVLARPLLRAWLYRKQGALQLRAASPDASNAQFFERMLTLYGAMASRDATHLQWMYPADAPRVAYYTASARGGQVGWLVTQMIEDNSPLESNRSGGLRIGSLHDMLAAPEHATALLAAGARLLRDAGADVVLVQHCHPDWQRALRAIGFVSSPSGFALYVAPAFARLLDEHALPVETLYVTRGDDGLHRS